MKYIPPNFKIVFDPQIIADALWINYDQAEKEFKDGRVVSRFSEYWTEKLYGFKKSSNTNTAMYDGYITNPLLGKLYISVRSLTKSGIRFQQSKFIGSGRHCNRDDLINSISNIDFEIVVDIVDFPCVMLSVVSAGNLLEKIKSGRITPSGLNRIKYYKELFNTTFNKMDVKKINPYELEVNDDSM
jgi:hypothetical protein